MSRTIRIKHWVFFLLFVTLFPVTHLFAQHKLPKEVCITFQEQRLRDLINDIRKSYGKNPLPLSISLTYVAQTHIKDLTEHHPDTSICNLSSWSDKGNWTPCCYNPYVVHHDCMWKKPKELTPYPYRGYEMAAWFQDTVTVDSLANLWTEQPEVLDMILTRGNWEQKKWRTFGAAMNHHYVSIWFGQRIDKMGKPKLCPTADATGSANHKPAMNKSSKTYYYIVFGSYNNSKDAKTAVKEFKKEGFDDAAWIESNGRFRTYLYKFSSLKDAMAAKQKLNPRYKDAWILKH